MAKNDENNPGGDVIESGVDNTRPANVIPDSSLIGGSRDGAKPAARRAAAPAAANKAVDDDDADTSESQPDAPEGEGGDAGDGKPAEGAAGAANGEADAADLTDDDLLDMLLESDGDGTPAAATQATTKTEQRGTPKKASDLEPTLKAEYDAAVERYGEELVNTVMLPGLLREQATNQRLQPLLSRHAEQFEEQQARAQREVSDFFTAKSTAGYAKVYGEGPNKASPVQIEAMKRVVAKAVEIKNKAQAAGISITPQKAMERAHNALWSKTPLGAKVAANQATMQQRANSTTMPTNRNAAGASSNVPAGGDPYAKVRGALKKAGITR